METTTPTRCPLNGLHSLAVICCPCGYKRSAAALETPPVCGHCGGRTDVEEVEPTMFGMRIAACGCLTGVKTVTCSAPLDSAVIDNALLVRVVERQNFIIDAAKWQLKKGLSLPVSSPRRDMHFALALKALGTLGAS